MDRNQSNVITPDAALLTAVLLILFTLAFVVIPVMSRRAERDTWRELPCATWEKQYYEQNTHVRVRWVCAEKATIGPVLPKDWP